MTTVFISYAGQDPQWPAETVKGLALKLESLGATVFLDQLHLERQPVPGKLSDAEWRDWMGEAMKAADRVICLASERYELATRRKLDEAWGYGVAFESMSLIAALYEQKGHNDKRLLTVRPDSCAKSCVPAPMRDTVPHYLWHSEHRELLEHALIRRLLPGEADSQPVVNLFAGQASISEPGQPSSSAASDPLAAGPQGSDKVPAEQAPAEAATVQIGVKLQADQARQKLEAHRPLFDAIVFHLDDELRGLLPPGVLTAPTPFVAWLARATRDDAQLVMWAVHSALEHHAGFCRDSAAQEAAVAVYMLCALRWVATRPEVDGSGVVSVPTVGKNVLAVLSAAYFGGQVQYALGAGPAQPLHVYDVRPAAGESASGNLLRAIYGSVFADDLSALDVARREDDDPQVIDEMLQRLRARLNDIRRRRKLAFTLVIEKAPPFAEASWRDQLGVTPFVEDGKLSQALFMVDPHGFDQQIKDLLRLFRAQEPATAPGPSPVPTAPTQPLA